MAKVAVSIPAAWGSALSRSSPVIIALLLEFMTSSLMLGSFPWPSISIEQNRVPKRNPAKTIHRVEDRDFRFEVLPQSNCEPMCPVPFDECRFRGLQGVSVSCAPFETRSLPYSLFQLDLLRLTRR
jgi:hypothetical protein